MEMWLFSLSSYTPNPHALPPLTVGLLVILLGLDVLFRQKASQISKAFLWLCTAVGLWLVSYAGILSAVFMPIAMIWIAIQSLALVFIPSLLYLFTLSVTGSLNKDRKRLWLLFTLSAVFFAVSTSTDLFIQGLYRYTWGLYPKAGPLCLGLVVYLFFVLGMCLRKLWLEYKQSASQINKQRMISFFIVFGTAHLAVVDFLPSFGIMLYPFGYLFIFASLIVAARGVWLYRLINITPAFAAKQIITTMMDILFVLDDRGSIQIVNEAACGLFGKKINDLIGAPMNRINPDVISQAKFDELFKTKEPVDYEVELILPKGKKILAVSMSVLLDEAGQPLAAVCIAKDITERKRMEEALHVREEQLRQAQKMEAIGRLAGGIAHDFNNIVTPIMGYTDMVMRGIDAESAPHKYLQQVKMAAERATGLANQLLTFSKHGVIAPKVMNLNKVLGEMNKMLRRLIGEDIEIVILFAEDLWSVRIDPIQFEQVIINLALNARDAMPKGGKFIIETNNIQYSPDYSRRKRNIEEGKYVMVAISDTGQGMDKETQARIFEPFFTTKEKGKGTGLGLATSYGIIEQAGGHILVYSEVNHGTTMKILLPAAKERPDDELIEEIPQTISGGSESILLVEDEPLVREMVCTVLGQYGYSVVETRNGGEALYYLDNNKDKHFDLVVTDVVMPQVGGKELAKEVRKRYPKTKILFTSGYTDGVIFQHGIVDPGINFLQKPFTPARLAIKVREVLDGKIKHTVEESNY
jgi:PAS domain S-box-containing protein